MHAAGEGSKAARAAWFLFLWATVGFALGTLTLLGPVRWATGALRARGAAQGTEDLAVRGIIVLLLVASALAARALARRMARAETRAARLRVPLATSALALGALLLWLNPRLVTGGGAVEGGGARFVFGPYPAEADLRRLRAEGYAGVVTLLHPAVVPFEPRLLAEERRAARAAGIRLVEAPMLPWISGNEASIGRIRELARATRGRYYVHCYLGKDRVNVVRRLLEQETLSGPAAERAAGARRLSDLPALERGGIYHLPDSVHVAPFPTDEEWFGYVLNGTVRQALSLLDPGNPEDTAWIARERALAAQYRLPLELSPVPSFPFQPERALAAARRARALPRPLVVHGFRTASPAVEAFVQAYRSGLPPLPPALFAEPMRTGRAEVLGPNVAAGPRPAGPDFGAYLQRRGVRAVVYLGGDDAAARADRPVAASVGMLWRSLPAGDPAALLRLLSAGGPWYVYGPGLVAALPVLRARLDPLVAP